MISKIHELYCGSFCPFHSHNYFPTQELTCRCLLIESSAGLILCDTGLPNFEHLSPSAKLKLKLMQAKNDPSHQCVQQVKRLGFDIKDVRHILITHLDIDHAGGISDFPWAEIHLHEADAVFFNQIPFRMKLRYYREFLPQGLKIKTYTEGGESWKGFDSVQAIKGLNDEILFIPLVGHTAGHSGIAIRHKDNWLFHCGDAFYFKEDLSPDQHKKNLASESLQTAVAFDNNLRIRTINRITLLANNKPEIAITNSHDPRLGIGQSFLK